MMTSATDNRAARVERLRLARVNDSQTKRQSALIVTRRLLKAGERISVARVARDAGVSTWLIYNAPEVAAAVTDAIAIQRRDGIHPDIQRSRAPLPSVDSLRTDLALARHEVTSLRTENVKLKLRLRTTLGAEAEGATLPELTERIEQLESANAALQRTLGERDAQIISLIEVRDALESDLEGKVEAIRRMMVTVNARQP